MIVELVAVNSYILAVYYRARSLFPNLYQNAISLREPLRERHEVFDLKDIFYCEKLAINHEFGYH